jgi:hypothetical protein
MSDLKTESSEPTAVDDVRNVREKIAREHGGDIRKHIEETARIGEGLRARLNVRVNRNEPKLARR